MCNWGWDHINYANWNTLKISGSGSWLTVESYAYVNDISKMTLTIDRLNDIENSPPTQRGRNADIYRD